MGTHFVLGSDNNKNMSETKSRFSGPAGIGAGVSERKANASKMQGDSVHIGGTNANFNNMTTSGSFFYNKDNANRHLNTNEQYKFMPNVNAFKSHYPQSGGSLAGAGSEQKSKFLGGPGGANPGIGADRLKFMKESHFDHANREKPMMGNTINKSALPTHMSPVKMNPADSNAFRLKNSQLSLGQKDAPTSYVTTNTLK